jgi:hypothetical protein
MEAAAPGGAMFMNTAVNLMRASFLQWHNPEDIMRATANIASYGLQPGYSSVSNAMISGNHPEIAALHQMIAKGDFSGIESLRNWGLSEDRLQSAKMEAFNIQAYRTGAMNSRYSFETSQSILEGSMAGGKLPSQLNLADVKRNATELANNLKKVAEDIKSVAGADSTQYKKAFSDFASAAANVKVISEKYANMIVSQGEAQSGVTLSSLAYQEASASLSMEGSASSLADIGFTGRSELSSSISMMEAQLPHLSGMDRLNAIARINSLKQQQLMAPYQSTQMAFQKADLMDYDIRRMELGNIAQRASSMPYAPGYRYGIAMAQIGQNTERVNQLQGRMNYLRDRGLLTPQMNYQLQAEMEGLNTASWREEAVISEGVENRMPALSAGAPSFYGRYNSNTLAAFNVYQAGSPIRAYGAFKYSQQEAQDAFYGSFQNARSRTEMFNNGDVVGVLKSIERLLQQSLGANPAFHPAAGLGYIPPSAGYRKTGANAPFN